MQILTEDIRPVADLKSKSNQLLRHVQRTQRPILLTKNGKPRAVLIDVKEFAAKLASKKLSQMLKEAEKEIAEGKGRDIEDFFEEFAQKHELSSLNHPHSRNGLGRYIVTKIPPAKIISE